MKKVKTLKKKNKVKGSSVNMVSYETAIQNIRNWRCHVGELINSQAFFISLQDIQGLYEELMSRDVPPMGIRCYMAKRSETGESHLLIVAVENDSADPESNGEDMYVKGGSDTNSLIYDVSKPCPRMCDPKSALFQNGEIKQLKQLKDLKLEKSKAGKKGKSKKK